MGFYIGEMFLMKQHGQEPTVMLAQAFNTTMKLFRMMLVS